MSNKSEISGATLIATAFYSVVFLPYYTCRIAGIDFKKYALEACVIPLVFSIFVVGGGWAVLKASSAGLYGLKQLGIAAFLLCLADYAAAFYLIVSREEKNEVYLLVDSMKRKIMYSRSAEGLV